LAGQASDLEQMSKIPIVHPNIMAQNFDKMSAFLKSVPSYKDAFSRAYPKEPIGEATILKALAAFERSIVAGTAPFDRWVAGDEKAISSKAKKGFKIFT